MKTRSSGKKKYWMGPFLVVIVVIGIALLASGRLRGCYPFVVRRDRPSEAGANPSLASAPTPSPETPGSLDQGAPSAPTRRRSPNLVEIEGIGPAYMEKLKAQGLKTTDDLLLAGASRKGRDELAEATGISGMLILRWVNQTDLFRIKGVGGEYAELLEAAGVDTVPELAQRRADNLTRQMADVNAQKKLVRRVPTEAQVARWIAAAQGLAEGDYLLRYRPWLRCTRILAEQTRLTIEEQG